VTSIFMYGMFLILSDEINDMAKLILCLLVKNRQKSN